jgi:hypothetical protein
VPDDSSGSMRRGAGAELRVVASRQSTVFVADLGLSQPVPANRLQPLIGERAGPLRGLRHTRPIEPVAPIGGLRVDLDQPQRSARLAVRGGSGADTANDAGPFGRVRRTQVDRDPAPHLGVAVLAALVEAFGDLSHGLRTSSVTGRSARH